MKKFSVVFLSFLLVLVLTFSSISLAAENAEDINQKATEDAVYKLTVLNDELQQGSESVFVWWVPGEFWSVLSETSSDSNEQIMLEMLGLELMPYNVFLISAGTPTKKGTTPISEKNIFKTLYLTDDTGQKFSPIELNLLPKQHRELFNSLSKDFLPNIFGEMSEGLYFFVFPASIDGQYPITTEKKSSFTLGACGEEFVWETPLKALLPLLTCPKCGDSKLNRDYKYCPWDGTKLPEPTDF